MGGGGTLLHPAMPGYPGGGGHLQDGQLGGGHGLLGGGHGHQGGGHGLQGGGQAIEGSPAETVGGEEAPAPGVPPAKVARRGRSGEGEDRAWRPW